MEPNPQFAVLASQESLDRAIAALKSHGIDSVVVETGEQAKAKALELIPKGAEVMNMTSQTLEATGIAKELNESGNYDSVRNKLNKMDRATQNREMQEIGAAPDWVIGSVHAVTEDGTVMIASNTGSQLPAYAGGSNHVVWVVGTHKIVTNREQGMKRIYEYSLPLESVRAHKAYGVEASAVNKILIVNAEVRPGRITIIFVKEKLGF